MAVLREDIVSLKFEVENDPVLLIGGEIQGAIARLQGLSDAAGAMAQRAVDSVRQFASMEQFSLPVPDVEAFRSAMEGLRMAVQGAAWGVQVGFSLMRSELAAFSDAMAVGAQQAVQRVVEMKGSIQSTLSSIQLSGIGSQIMQGLLQGILSQRGAILGAVQEIAAGIKNTIASAMRIASPSKEMAELGRFIGLGLPDGMRAALPEIKAGALQMTLAATPVTGAEPGGGKVAASPVLSPTAVGSGVVNHNTYAPQFTMTVQGGQSATDRELERKVKSWVKESFEKVIAAAARSAPMGREV